MTLRPKRGRPPKRMQALASWVHVTIEIGPFSSLFYDLFSFHCHFPAVRPLLRNLRLFYEGGSTGNWDCLWLSSRHDGMPPKPNPLSPGANKIEARLCALFIRMHAASLPLVLLSGPVWPNPKYEFPACPTLPFHPPLLLTERCKTPPRSKNDRSENLPCHTSLRS